MFQWIENKNSLLLALFASITIVVVKTTEAFNVCGPTTNDETSSSLIFVSTLDGKLTALDLGENGKPKWSLDFDDEPMLSSGTHGRELNNDGSWIRMIPSLNGGLYVFDGNNVKAVPITTDQLLKSSYRYSEDVVFSGGKETRSYGVSSTTGKIIYQCNINGCSNKTDDDSYIEHDDVLIVQRFQQTVRAVEPRTGHEKWNFSVGQYQIELIPRESHDCNNKLTNIANDIELRVVVPDGIVWAINKTNPNVKLWQHKFDSPIVSIWREGASNDNDRSSKLKSVNLFDSTNWSKGSNFIESPSIYVGMHDKQLYIQENTDKINELNIKTTKQTTFPWQPYQATDTAIAVVENSPKTTALSILYNTEYVNGNGFYLHTKEHHEESHQCNKTEENIIIPQVETTTTTATTNYDNSSNDNDNNVDEETPVQIIIVSLWYWWKEVIIISITSAILLNFMLPQKLLNATTPAKDGVLPPLVVERHFETSKEDDRKLSFNNQDNNLDFKSRYLTDFEPIDCLGKGGYGVVFEAKNKIDDCMYAIKRISLPNSQDSRDRVMREVKALAKLDHHNIVRYFNAWLECPPAGWQETHDSKFIDKMRFSPSELPSETSMSTKPSDQVCIDVPSSNRSSVDSAFEAVELNKINDDDSYIVFESSESSKSNKSSIFIEDKLDNNDNSDSIVFQNSTSSANNNLNTTKSINNNDTIDESQSIIFDASISNLNIAEKNKKKASFSLDLNNINNTNTKNNNKTTNNNNKNNKKTPKMLLYIQMQLCQRKSLRDWLKNQSTPRDSSKIILIFQQIVDAVEYVHLQGLIHRDLKPSNIFFALDDKIKIGDFGLVTAMTEGYDNVGTPNDDTYEINEKNGIHTACVGTHLYMSPEQSDGQSYNYKVDIYSLGIILFELLNAFSTEMERVTALLNLRKTIFPHGFEDNYPNEYKLLKMMLDINPSKRPTTYGIKAQPPLNRTETDGLSDDGDKWHFDLPQISRHSSTTGSSSSGTGES